MVVRYLTARRNGRAFSVIAVCLTSGRNGRAFSVAVIYQTARRTGRVFILCGSYIPGSKKKWKGIQCDS